VSIDADDKVAALEFGLSADLPVDHILDDGVTCIVKDDFEGEFLLFWGLDYIDVPAGALPDLTKHFVLHLVDLNLIIQQHDK
jgi:hypothetical protein